MVDYKLLHALATVVECGGFERAGDVMGLSQSAISQRIKALEIRLGQPVLVPGDMGRASYLAVGGPLAMERSFGSSCHGAVVSAAEARLGGRLRATT